MADLSKIQDEEIRKRCEEANGFLRTGKPTDAVRVLADTFLLMLERKPEIMQAPTTVRGRQMPVAMRWPSLGANLSVESLRSGTPRIEFTRERFALSEAITYYEFTVETAIDQGV